jgi:hypothetical protein
MVERITVNPEEIRGLGNIVNKHDMDDYITYNCSIEEGTAIIGGVETEVYEMDTESSAITVSLTASATNVTVGTIVTLTATVLNESTPVTNADVDFRLGTTVIATSTTNSNGVATYEYTTDTIGTVSMYARSHNVLSTGVDITAIKHTTTTTMTTDHSTVLVLSDVLLTATVLDEDDNPVVNEYVDFYAKWTSQPSYLAPRRTDSNGVATYTYHTNRTGDIEVYAVHGASNYYARSESTHVTLKVTNYTLDVELGIAQIVGSTVTFHLTAKHEGSLVTDSLNFKLYDDGTQIQTGTLTTGGANLVVNNASGDYKVVIEESTNYPESESNTVTV